MSTGVQVELSELIALQRFARKVNYKPELKASRAGNHLSKLRGRGMDFSEVRNYQAGDEIRHMEWRVTARTGRPHIKLYQEERERPVVILVDFSPSMHFGTRVAFKSVIAAKLAAMIAWTAVKQGDRVGGLFYDTQNHCEIMPKSRPTGVLALLGKLTEYCQRPCHSFNNGQALALNDALIRLRRVARPGGILVIISDFYQLNDDCLHNLRRLREHNDLLAYNIADPLELAPPKPNKYAVTDGQHEALIDFFNPQLKNEYQLWCHTRLEKLEQGFKQLNTQLVQVTGENDIPRLIYRTYPRRTHE